MRRVSDLNYVIAMPCRRKSTKLYHVDLLKQYHSRQSACSPGELGVPAVRTVLVAGSVFDSTTCAAEVVGTEGEELVSDDALLQGRLKNSETLKDLDILVGHLDTDKGTEMIKLITVHPSLFSDTPSRTHLIEHDIDVNNSEPVKQRFYRVSDEKRRQLDAEVHC